MLSAPAYSKEDSSPEALHSSETDIPKNRYLIFFGIFAIGLALDLITKQSVFDWLGLPGASPNNTYWIWQGYVGIQTAVNQGALFGLGSGYGIVFVILSITAAMGIPYWLFFRGAAHDRLLTIALGSVMGGIFGNLYDRLGLWHSSDIADQFRCGVRDWILLRFHQYTWPNFNIADCMLVCGAGLLMLHLFLHQDPPADVDDSKASQANPP